MTTLPLLKLRAQVQADLGAARVAASRADDGIPLSAYLPQRYMVLVACGSFSPVTLLHLRIFEEARNHLQRTLPTRGSTEQAFRVIGGFLSPVHQGYAKKGLLPAKHRLAMCRLAVASSEWVDVAAWEAEQPEWSRTATVVQHYSRVVNECVQQLAEEAGCELPFVQVRLLCGSDVLDVMPDPKVWSRPHVDILLGDDYGVVCIERNGANSEAVVFKNELLYSRRHVISLVPTRVQNNVSSSVVRRLLRRGQSVRYLVTDDVLDYLLEHKLFAPRARL